MQPDKISPFVITGCGRSGTTYIAKILNQIGCRCKHEDYFPRLVKIGRFFISNRHDFFIKFNKVGWRIPPYGEIAWQAAAYLEYLPTATIIFHQVRHPVNFIKSRQKKGLVGYKLRNRFCPIPVKSSNVWEFGSLPIHEQVQYLAEFWIRWNCMVEQKTRQGGYTYIRYCLENIDTAQIHEILRSIGFQAELWKIQSVFESLPQNIHSLGKNTEHITIDMLSNTGRENLIKEACRYGYDLT